MWEPIVAITVLVLTVLAFVGFFAYAARQGAAMERTKAERIARARRTHATVISVSPGRGGVRRGARNAPEMVLKLLVDGRPVEARWCVYELGIARMREGERFPVRVDAVDPSIIYPVQEWAEISTFEWVKILKS